MKNFASIATLTVLFTIGQATGAMSAVTTPGVARLWFLVPHDPFFGWVKARHGHTPKWGDVWHYPSIGKDLSAYLAEWELKAPSEDQSTLD